MQQKRKRTFQRGLGDWVDRPNPGSSYLTWVMGHMPLSQFSECWVLSQLFHSPLSLSSRGSLVLCFLPWETLETVRDFIFLGSKITADGDCSLEIKRRLLLGRKVMTNLDSILKSRDIALPAKVHLVKAMVFPVVMYGCESWTIKLHIEELMLLNCGVGEGSWESSALQGDPTSPS